MAPAVRGRCDAPGIAVSTEPDSNQLPAKPKVGKEVQHALTVVVCRIVTINF